MRVIQNVLCLLLLLLLRGATAFVAFSKSGRSINSQNLAVKSHGTTTTRPYSTCFMSSQAHDEEISSENKPPQVVPDTVVPPQSPPNPLKTFHSMFDRDESTPGRTRPPIQVDDSDLMLFDVFLLINLSVSISFWVTHRLQLDFIGLAFNEGCLLALCWVCAGLWNGVFLNSAVDGHYRSSDDKAGPKAAGLLALNTFVGTTNLRLLFALLVAVFEHRPVGGMGGEELMPLELGCGLLLMSAWRTLHSSITPRI